MLRWLKDHDMLSRLCVGGAKRNIIPSIARNRRICWQSSALQRRWYATAEDEVSNQTTSDGPAIFFHADTIICETPSTATPEGILSAIKPSTREFAKKSTIVLAATPSFANWLGPNGTFLANFLSRIVPQQHSGDIEAVVAVVDRITRPRFKLIEGTADPNNLFAYDGDEGLCWTVGDSVSFKSVPAAVEPEGTFNAKPTGLRALSVILRPVQRRQAKHSVSKTNYELSLPLANTIFTTGHEQTLYSTSWSKTTGESRLTYAGKSDLQSITLLPPWTLLSIFDARSDSARMNLSAPLFPLTAPRKVVAGMGNIIRQLAHPETAETMPASRELEDNVQSYFRLTGVAARAMTVWALVMPIALFDMVKPNNSPYWQWVKERDSQVALQKSLAHGTPNWTTNFRAAFRQGATLHRVMSGGGGWGKKAGLLSLDPDISLSGKASELSAELPFSIPGFDMSETEATGLPEIAKPGTYVQFFATDTEAVRDHNFQMYLPDDTKRIVSADFGTIPSSIDTLPGDSRQPEPERVERPVEFIDGHFGVLSEAGMYLRIYPDESVDNAQADLCQTKIDVPFSRLSIFKSLRLADAGYQSMNGSSPEAGTEGLAHTGNSKPFVRYHEVASREDSSSSPYLETPYTLKELDPNLEDFSEALPSQDHEAGIIDSPSEGPRQLLADIGQQFGPQALKDLHANKQKTKGFYKAIREHNKPRAKDESAPPISYDISMSKPTLKFYSTYQEGLAAKALPSAFLDPILRKEEARIRYQRVGKPEEFQQAGLSEESSPVGGTNASGKDQKLVSYYQSSSALDDSSEAHLNTQRTLEPQPAAQLKQVGRTRVRKGVAIRKVVLRNEAASTSCYPSVIPREKHKAEEETASATVIRLRKVALDYKEGESHIFTAAPPTSSLEFSQTEIAPLSYQSLDQQVTSEVDLHSLVERSNQTDKLSAIYRAQPIHDHETPEGRKRIRRERRERTRRIAMVARHLRDGFANSTRRAVPKETELSTHPLDELTGAQKPFKITRQFIGLKTPSRVIMAIHEQDRDIRGIVAEVVDIMGPTETARELLSTALPKKLSVASASLHALINWNQRNINQLATELTGLGGSVLLGNRITRHAYAKFALRSISDLETLCRRIHRQTAQYYLEYGKILFELSSHKHQPVGLPRMPVSGSLAVRSFPSYGTNKTPKQRRRATLRLHLSARERRAIRHRKAKASPPGRHFEIRKYIPRWKYTARRDRGPSILRYRITLPIRIRRFLSAKEETDHLRATRIRRLADHKPRTGVKRSVKLVRPITSEGPEGDQEARERREMELQMKWLWSTIEQRGRSAARERAMARVMRRRGPGWRKGMVRMEAAELAESVASLLKGF